jgi:hypothetical protein
VDWGGEKIRGNHIKIRLKSEIRKRPSRYKKSFSTRSGRMKRVEPIMRIRREIKIDDKRGWIKKKKNESTTHDGFGGGGVDISTPCNLNDRESRKQRDEIKHVKTTDI